MKFFLATFGLEFALLMLVFSIIWMGLKVKITLIKQLFFSLAAVVIAIMLYEFTLTLIKQPESTITYSHEYFQHNKRLGYGVSDSLFVVKATKRWKTTSQKIYDATYTFAKGRRVTPNSDSLSNRYGLFLGGSFTFGEGINDQETLPYLYNENAPRKLNIRNYGFHGYGTHQVYTIVKNQIVQDKDLLHAEKVQVFYWFFNEHIARASGYSPWDQNGPLYAMNDNQLEYMGSFRQKKKKDWLIKRGFRILWERSAIYQLHLKPRWTRGEKEVDLFLNLVKEADILLKKQEFEFTVLIQDTSELDPLFVKHHQGTIRKIKQYFDTQSISYIDLKKAPLLKVDKMKPLFIEGDGHPTGEFNKRLASYLWEEINGQAKILE